MKHKRLISAIFLLSFWMRSYAQWTQLPNFAGLERDDGVGYVIGNKAYCGTGLQVGWGLTKDFYEFDLTTETWTTGIPLPNGAERQYACGFTDGIDGYVFGGEAFGSDLNDLWMYSPVMPGWMPMPSKPGNGVRGATCFVLYNMAYVIGGAYSTTDALNEVWAYNLTSGTWTQMNNLPFTCWRASAAAVNNKGYLIFGREANGRFRKELYEYNPVGDTWTQISTFPGSGRAYCTMQNINNDLFLFGGLDTLNNYYSTVWSYEISSSQWTQRSSLPSFGRKGGMGFTSNNILYYTCGIDQSNTRLKETWKYDVTVGIQEIDKNEPLSIVPNPASDLITIREAKSILQNKAYKIINMQGEVVIDGTLNENGYIYLTSLSQGVYQLLIGNSSARIIVQ